MNGKREIQNTKIPNNIIVLLTCSELKAKQLGSDYHSRIHKVYQATAPLTSDVVTLLKPPKPRSTIFEYIFYEHWNWKSQLITSLSLDNNLNFYNRLGIFNQVINAQCSGIHLINPPKDPAFVIWLNQILNNRYYFNNGNYINLPDEFSITCETKDITFDKKVISYNIKHGEIPACDFVLNTQTIFELDNFLTQHHLTTLRLWINQPLSNGVWILLMEKLQKRDITFILSPNVTIPNEIVTNIQPTDAVELPKVINEKIQLIKTNDIYFSLMKLEKNHSLSFPITDKTSIQDLTYRLRFDRENMSIKKIDSAFSEAIKNGQDIILYGDFSEEIQQYLYCLYVNSTAKITIITDNDKALSQMPNQIELCNFNSRCSMVFGDGYQQLRKIAFKLQQALNLEFSTSQLIAIKDNLDKHPNKNPFYPILRICPEYRRHYKAVAKQIFPTHKINNRSDVDFMSKRENKFKAGLIEKPFTFIIGESGVGKSTFVLEYFEKNDASLFCGEENLLAWLLSPHDKGLQVLFIDEANLSDAHHWDFLDTLVETSPFVIWQGTRYNLSQNHKVVFTGNYSDFKDRSVMHLAERHGNVIEFKPFSRAYLLSHIGTMLNQYLKDVLLIFLLKFGILDQYLKHKENLGLTIRDLNEKIFSIAQMLIAIEKDTNKTIDFSNQVMFNENYNIFKENFNGDTNTIQHDLLKNLEKLGMVITDNWIEPLKVLSKWITQLTNTGHGVQKQGIILEGEPGIGKSLCAELILKAHGYLEGIVTGANNNMYSNSYYKVTVNNIALLEVVLKKVFHEGAVDILDEINTAPLEGLLNQYLTGRDPQGNLAKKPGFGIIGTQNGVNFSGRRQGSHAWKNRFTTIKIAEYNESDLMKVYQFYQNKYLTKYQVMLTDELETKLLNLSHQYIDEYREAIIYGKENHCSPLPCARDVIDAIKIKIKKTIIDFNNINTVTMRSGENSFLGKRTASDCEKPKKIHHSEKTSSGCFGLKPLNR